MSYRNGTDVVSFKIYRRHLMSIYSIDNSSPYTEFKTYSETKNVEDSGEKKDGGLSFSDILDIVNPLQHIPVVSTVYRSITGDKISPVSRLIGGTIFGQLFGFVAAAVNVVIEAVTGKDIGDHVIAAISWNSGEKAASSKSNSEKDSTMSTLDVPAAEPVPHLVHVFKQGNDHPAKNFDTSNSTIDALSNFSEDALLNFSDTKKVNPMVYFESIKKYEETEKIIESKNYQTYDQISIVV